LTPEVAVEDDARFLTPAGIKARFLEQLSEGLASGLQGDR
jgi:hypothetical protein